uniref:Double-strand break repair protein n=1 Tax=Anopheles atroparvus TaxID=41427 RepID=A0A182J7C6_ANOAO
MSQESSLNGEINPDDTIKLLVASDIHLGYEEKDPIRGEDSFIAFEEVLQQAVVNDVDAILLGGDLFHIANPSKNTLKRCTDLLKAYTLGDKPISLQFVNERNEDGFESFSRMLNYEDPNVNISIPVFSIHGNHDDPSGFGRISSVELLSSNGYVNYFGKWVDLRRIVIKPILLKKGETKLALYGLGHIHDARLCRMFDEAKVFMQKPDDPGWFNVMVLHQNRADRGVKNYLPENALPKFLDLVIWGHEHDCRIIPEQNVVKEFFVIQPGSTVATSLSEGDSIQKCCGLLSFHKGHFRMDPIPLKTVRPFVFESVNLASYQDERRLDEGDVMKKVQEFAAERIEALMERAKAQLTGDDRQPQLPLIRLRLEITETKQQFNAIRFGRNYLGRVGNPIDMVIFKRKMSRVNHESTNMLDDAAIKEQFKKQQREEQWGLRAEEIAENYFKDVKGTDQKLEIMCPRSMTELVRRLKDQQDCEAADICKFYEEKAVKFLEAQADSVVTGENIDEVFAGFHEHESNLYDQMLAMLDLKASKTSNDQGSEQGDSGTGKRTRGGSRGGARGARGAGTGKTTRGARGGKKADVVPPVTEVQSKKSPIASVATRTNSTNKSRSIDYDSDSKSD